MLPIGQKGTGYNLGGFESRTKIKQYSVIPYNGVGDIICHNLNTDIAIVVQYYKD